MTREMVPCNAVANPNPTVGEFPFVMPNAGLAIDEQVSWLAREHGVSTVLMPVDAFEALCMMKAVDASMASSGVVVTHSGVRAIRQPKGPWMAFGEKPCKVMWR